MAPELFQKRAYDGSVDVFAYGSMLWEILLREVPYAGWDAPDIAKADISGDRLKDSSIMQ